MNIQIAKALSGKAELKIKKNPKFIERCPKCGSIVRYVGQSIDDRNDYHCIEFYCINADCGWEKSEIIAFDD